MNGLDNRREILEIRQRLNDRVLEVCRWLLPHGRQTARTWNANHPFKDEQGQTPELHVYYRGIVGSWKDYRSGEKGDLLTLIQLCLGTDFKGAMDQAKDFLGIHTLSAAERRQAQQQAAERSAADLEKARRKEDAKRREAEKRFLSGAMLGVGSPAEMHARAYLYEARGIDLDKIVNLDRTSIRFLPDCEYWTLAEWRRDPNSGIFRKVKEGPRLPAMLCAMRGPLGQFVDHHITFLDPRKPEKADLGTDKKGRKRSPRLMSLPNAGAVIRISHGPEGKPPEHSTEPHPLIEGEGFETSASLAQAIAEARVWACGSINGIRNAPDNFPFVASILIAGENDWNKPQAQEALHAALAAKEDTGKPYELMLSHVGSDFNDLMKGD